MCHLPLAPAGSSLDSGCVVDFPTETIVNCQTSKDFQAWLVMSSQTRKTIFSAMPTKAWKAQCNKIQQTHFHGLNVLKAGKAQRKKNLLGVADWRNSNGVPVQSCTIYIYRNLAWKWTPREFESRNHIASQCFASLRDLRGLGSRTPICNLHLGHPTVHWAPHRWPVHQLHPKSARGLPSVTKVAPRYCCYGTLCDSNLQLHGTNM